MIDVKGGQSINGNKVWQFDLNHSKAQIFKITKLNLPANLDSQHFRIMEFNANGSGRFITAKKEGLKVLPKEPTNKSNNKSSAAGAPQKAIEDNPSIDNTSNSLNIALKKYNITIEEGFNASPESSAFNSLDVTNINSSDKKQIWELSPVLNELNTYLILTEHSGEKVALQPGSLKSGGDLVLAKRSGADIQKWKILPVTPEPPELLNITLQDFNIVNPPIYKFWKNSKLHLTIRWNDTNNDAVGYKVLFSLANGDATEIESNLMPNTREYTYVKELSGAAGNFPEYCFVVTKRNKWNFNSSSAKKCIKVLTQTPEDPFKDKD
ncbi:hypothetical protein FG167_09300 [Lacinutrix sp. WUR7]|uniref:RICIN domain-containing protein n=1 Tax=Lacinutrix sp. WUR7 TaxID=2653681 RepID=UPI00193E72AC|nr:hypothetical protein [Lacinutrix sp. WUR7]QRM89426.1 hypothetical protein FG167_09300 [Lacinutrix sp. WUR7]